VNDEVVIKTPFVACLAGQSSSELLHFRASDDLLPTLCVNVDYAQPKPIFLYYAVDPLVTGLANGPFQRQPCCRL
jgi:hypothetical protein